jgi:hypothetical protein
MNDQILKLITAAYKAPPTPGLVFWWRLSRLTGWVQLKNAGPLMAALFETDPEKHEGEALVVVEGGAA